MKRRVLSILLAAALACSLAAPALAAEGGPVDLSRFSDAGAITHREAVATLADLGVIAGKDDGAFHPTDGVTRAEAAKLLSTLMTGSQTPPAGSGSETSFSDIQNHWAKGYIEHCAGAGIINGRGDGTFDPDGRVTAHELAKMTLSVLGYGGMTGQSWLVRVDAYATNVGLVLDLPEHFGPGKPLGNTFASRDDAAQMLYNALRAAPDLKVVATASGGEVAWSYDEATGLYAPTYEEAKPLLAPRFLSLGLPPISSNPSQEQEPEPSAPAESIDPTDYADRDEIEHKEAVDALIRLGLFWGKEDGSYFDPKGAVTRGEAAKLIALLMCGGKDTMAEDPKSWVKDPPSFSDIQGHWAEPYIEFCADLDIAVDDGSGAFDPSGLLTGHELLRMSLTALGYDAEAYKLVGEDWKDRVYDVAKVCSPSLFDGLSGVSMGEPASRDTVAQVLYNALQNHPMVLSPSPDSSSGGVIWNFGLSDVTLLYQRFGLTEFPAPPEKK